MYDIFDNKTNVVQGEFESEVRKWKILRSLSGDFPGGPAVKIPRLHCRGFDPWSRN